MRRYEERYEEWTPCMVCGERYEDDPSNIEGICMECAHIVREQLEDLAEEHLSTDEWYVAVVLLGRAFSGLRRIG